MIIKGKQNIKHETFKKPVGVVTFALSNRFLFINKLLTGKNKLAAFLNSIYVFEFPIIGIHGSAGHRTVLKRKCNHALRHDSCGFVTISG